MILFHTTAMPRGWERHPQTGRTLFDWSHDTNQLFFEVRCTNFKFPSSWQVSSNFPFTGYQKVEAISCWGKVCCFGCLLWNYIFKSSHSNTSSEICFNQVSHQRGFQSMDSSFRPTCRNSRTWTLMRLSYHVLEPSKRVVQEDLGRICRFFRFLLL